MESHAAPSDDATAEQPATGVADTTTAPERRSRPAKKKRATLTVQTGVSRVIDDEKPPGQVWTPAAVKMVMDIVNKHIDGILDKVRSDPQVTLTPEMFMAIVHEAARTAGLGSDLQQAMGYRAVYFGPS